MKQVLILLYCTLVFQYANAQSNKGISFQAIARKQNGLIIPNQAIAIRLSIMNDTLSGAIEYQEIKSVTTNVLGLFTIVLGIEEPGKIISIGNFENIVWTSPEKYLQIEIDPYGGLIFEKLAIQRINYVPFSFYTENVHAKNVAGVISVKQGGTGLTSIKEIAGLLNIDKINNTPDSLKPISILANVALNERLKKLDTLFLSNRINTKLNITDTVKLSKRIDTKLNAQDTTDLIDRIDLKLNKKDTSSLSARINLKLNKADTISLSNRIDTKLNITDTVKLSKRIDTKLNAQDTTDLIDKISLKLNKKDTSSLSTRINLKLNKADTVSLSNRINNKINIGDINSTDIKTALGYIPMRIAYGSFFDTAKQQALVSVATPIKFSFTHIAADISITNNSNAAPTRITVKYAGTYAIKYICQFLKADLTTDEVSIWLRRNGSAYANTNIPYTITGNNFKNILSSTYFVELGEDDYVEVYFSVKNANSVLTGSLTQSSPSRPATAAAAVTIHRVN